MEVEILLVDVIDNQIETTQTRTKSLDRKKRDLDDAKETVLDSNVTEKDEHDPNERIDRDVSGDVKREVRQLRPPPIGQPSWQYNSDFELANANHEPQSPGLGSERGFARDQGISLNYNPFLVPPSSRSNQFFKNGGPNEFFNLSPFRNTYTSVKGAQSNAVTEFNSHKPFTAHTSFQLDDAPAQHNGKYPSKEGFTPSAPFYPVGAQKPQTAVRATADNLPDNFSYYHIGNTGGKSERDSFQHRPAQQAQQQAPRLPQPQAPIYYLNKPVKLLGASTPKNHYIQFSTVGGFFNNNPTAFAPIDNQKKQKLRLSTEKYDVVTHRPIYRDPAQVPVRAEPNINDNSHYEIHDVDQPYIRPNAAHRPTSTPSSSPFYSKDVTGNANGNEKDAPAKLYTYHVTTEEIKIPLPNQNKGFFITPNSQPNEAHLKVISNKPNFAQPPSPDKQHSTNKRPSGQDITANRFIEDVRDSHRTQITKPKQVLHTQHLPNEFLLPNKVSTSTVQNFKPETTSLGGSDDYYYYDSEEDTKISTPKKRPIEVEQTTYRIDQRYTPTTTKTTAPTTVKVFNGNNQFQHQTQFELKPRPPKIQPLTQEYIEYDDDEEYDDDVNDEKNEFNYKLPPVNVSKFMPMSETAAPRPAYLMTTTSRPKLSSTTRKYGKPHVASVVPAIIKFPEDIFHGVRPMHEHDSNATRYLDQSTQRPYTARTRTKPTNLPSSKTYTLMTKTPPTRTTETTTPTTTVSIGKPHRPYTKTRGQDNSNTNRFTNASKRPNALKKHLWELDERLPNRYKLYRYTKLQYTPQFACKKLMKKNEKYLAVQSSIHNNANIMNFTELRHRHRRPVQIVITTTHRIRRIKIHHNSIRTFPYTMKRPPMMICTETVSLRWTD